MLNAEFKKETFKNSVRENVKMLYRKNLEEASQQEIYQAVCYAVKDVIIDNWLKTQKAMDEQDPKILYYMSMEFLMGRALGNNLINLTAYKQVQEALEEMGLNLNLLEDQERDPALGNGGLGRLAACFLDSLATLGYPAYGCGIRYKYGMFKQQIRDGYQVEVPDNWLKEGNPFEIRREEYAKEVRFGGNIRFEKDPVTGKDKFIQENYESVMAVPYDMPIVGYGNHVVNTLRVWDAKPITDFKLDEFDRGNYHKAVEQENLARNIVEVLYPNDNHYAGKELRLKQQYFFVSASLQAAIAKYKKKHGDIHKLYEKVTFQMNDTHPTVAVAELMRILMDEEGLGWDEAWEVTTKSVAYTNHTIMSEALEKWPIELFSRLLPRVYQIVQEIDRRFVEQVRRMYPGNEDKVRKMAILMDGQVRMAHMAIIAGYSVNGVARLHTEILKHQELKDFYEMMPEKFNNKTNGITQRRWLALCNPELSALITKLLGNADWVKNLDELKKLEKYADDEAVLNEFMAVKEAQKNRLAAFVKEHDGVDIDPNTIFDIQIKRLHEYKRQFLNALSILYIYYGIKDGSIKDFTPTTFIFGAKSAPGYRRAKAIIKLIGEISKLVNADPDTKDLIKVVFVQNYNVSYAEKLVTAADVSEQISTAGTEASGTGNMKLMLNGAVTLGTYDGANVEIVQEAGEENNYIFGARVEELAEIMPKYDPREILFSNDKIKRVLDKLIDGSLSDGGVPSNEEGSFKELYKALTDGASWHVPDHYYVLGDLESYVQAKLKVNADYKDKLAFAKKCWLNIANAGKFSSDRTIKDYAENIWKIEPVKL